MNNRMHNAQNGWQGDRVRTLCLCSAGLLRSPTAAVVLAQHFDRNTRAAGLEESYALIPVDKVLVSWADEVVVMTRQHEQMFKLMFPEYDGVLIRLDIPDRFGYMDPDLVHHIKKEYAEHATG